MTHTPAPSDQTEQSRRMIKCVVWDLDNTIWDGVLLEDPRITLRPRIADVIRTLDDRGIVHSIASRNDHDAAIAALRRLDIHDYFLYPQINWGAKSGSIRAIASSLNLGLAAFAFVDDDEFERREVAFELPEVMCVDAAEAGELAELPELMPKLVTEDSQRRRLLYRADETRRTAESRFTGPTEEFLATLGMRLRITPAAEDDLSRAEELTVRTNQLNTTGYTYSYADLDRFRASSGHKLFVAKLDDRFGPYGTIGLTLVAVDESVWTIKLLLMSCRVLSRGIGAIMITYLRHLARDAGARLRAEFRPNGRNRMMYVTYRLSRFREIGRDGDLVRLQCDPTGIPPFPDYVDVEATDEDGRPYRGR